MFTCVSSQQPNRNRYEDRQQTDPEQWFGCSAVGSRALSAAADTTSPPAIDKTHEKVHSHLSGDAEPIFF